MKLDAPYARQKLSQRATFPISTSHIVVAWRSAKLIIPQIS